MTASQSTATHYGEVFVCDCDEWMRSACNKEAFPREHDGKRYCVLHYPSIEKKVDFQNALDRKIREDDFNFRGVWFPGEVSFRNLTLSVKADFSYAYFNAKARFSDTKFCEEADFDGVQFTAFADFRRVQFSAKADFSYARFTAAADFSDAQFSANGYFVEAVFNTNLYFRRTAFIVTDSTLDGCVKGNDKAISIVDGHVGESQLHQCLFGGARFKDGVIFRENKFAGHALMSFDDAVFERPERVTFHTVDLRPHWFVNVDSSKLNFMNVKWGSPDTPYVVSKEITALAERNVPDASRLLAVTLRHLAVNAEENHRYGEAVNFRYMAMDVKRIDIGFIHNLVSLSWWYWLLSGYGERVMRAFGALIVIWLVFAVFYYSGNSTWWQPKQSSKAAAESNEGERSVAQPFTLPDALIYSISVMALQKPEPLPANKRAKGLVLLETVLGPLQAALLALAIRRKFMR